MFRATRTRLLSLNAAVFFITLTVFSTVIYMYISLNLYNKVDESLAERSSQFLQPSDMMKRNVQIIDPASFLVLWDADGNAFPLLKEDEYNDSVIGVLNNYRTATDPRTIRIENHYYRVQMLKLDQSKTVLLPTSIFPGGKTTKVVSAHAVINVDSEVHMLRNLMQIIGIGIVVGAVGTVLASLFLANQALRPIRRSWEQQQQFVADASHELRMPISVIHANAEHVFRHPDRSILQMSEPISMVLKESKRMKKLVEQLLTLARADSNQTELLLAEIRLDKVVSESAQKFNPFMELKRIRFDMTVQPVSMMGDKERLQQLIVILLDNSLKYTPEDGEIRVVCRRNSHDAVLIVEDSGIGISKADLPHIFDRFYRGDQTRNRDDGGTGLGLSIAKWIVEKHSGTISVRSNQTTAVTVKLPLHSKLGG
ncbi:sensor histidine kinase [Paenibacillus nasutitermitis]|uniref:histidine kinase n=1 Tax=Paenibacillus nasutitermitis TaxID=1652958 RepID=A0A916YKV4_9BACL|nr:HAMP domain-containing sensor histidine kinase [Paenibacillus nasutitermitis]GGD50679.1 two-component sensor histidine kinase [Paenibacillus nasutitermitis]